MQIRITTLEKMNTLTNREMDFLLYIARFQDEDGYVQGVYWKDLCKNQNEHLRMCKQTFYNALYALRDKGLISFERIERGDHEIRILDNAAYNPEEGVAYINLNRTIFRSKGFMQMKAKEKFMLMDLMRWTGENQGKRSVGMENFYARYRKKLQVSDRLIRQYLHTLKKYFLIVLKAGKYFIQFVPSRFTQPKKGGRGYGGKDQRRDYLARLILRRCKIKEYPERVVDSLIELIRQYTNEIQDRGLKVEKVFQSCIRKCTVGDIDPEINPAYLNKLIQQRIR